MALLTRAPRGTLDVTPAESYKWQYIEKTAADTARVFGFSEIRTPTFEATELFTRSVGDTTDVVQKEMYTFTDKGGRSITLRPEGTAGAMRAVLEHSLLGDALPLKLYYFTSCFRYEKPQAGRFREHTQFGVELLGSKSPLADAQVISLAHTYLTRLGLKDFSLEINSIGCKECRPEYHKILRAYFAQYKDQLCPDCLNRLEKNPMRLLDCKVETCKAVSANAPVITDYICGECKDHFESLKAVLSAAGIDYIVNPKIVRGLDYYTKTVFEFVTDCIGSQRTICGGGRYDALIEELGGPPTPSLGFGSGINRVLLAMEAQGVQIPTPAPCDLYIGSTDPEAAAVAEKLALQLRKSGFWVEADIMGRSVKAQMKYANKLAARYSLILGSNELESGNASLKNMTDGETCSVQLDAGEIAAKLA